MNNWIVRGTLFSIPWKYNFPEKDLYSIRITTYRRS